MSVRTLAQNLQQIDTVNCHRPRWSNVADAEELELDNGNAIPPHVKYFKGGTSTRASRHKIFAGEIPLWEAAASATKGKDKSAIGAGDKDRFQDRGTPMATIYHAGQTLTQQNKWLPMWRENARTEMDTSRRKHPFQPTIKIIHRWGSRALSHKQR